MKNIIASVTKHITFDAAHFLINYDWDIAQNIEVFHACSVYKDFEGILKEPHGHTYHVEVTVEGIVDSGTGFVIDFKKLKSILNDSIIAKMDHRLINNIAYFAESRKSPTVENMLHYIWDEICTPVDALRPHLAWLESIRVWETPDSFATLTRNMKFACSDDSDDSDDSATCCGPCEGSCEGSCDGSCGDNCCKKNKDMEE